MDKRVDLAVALAIMTFGIWFFAQAQSIPHGSIDDPLGESGLPTALGAFFALGGAALIIRRLATWHHYSGPAVPPDGVEDLPDIPSSKVRAFALWGTAGAYVLSLPWLGYLLATPLFLLVGTKIMGMRGWLRAGATSIVFTAVVYSLFVEVFSTSLPQFSFR